MERTKFIVPVMVLSGIVTIFSFYIVSKVAHEYFFIFSKTMMAGSFSSEFLAGVTLTNISDFHFNKNRCDITKHNWDKILNEIKLENFINIIFFCTYFCAVIFLGVIAGGFFSAMTIR